MKSLVSNASGARVLLASAMALFPVMAMAQVSHLSMARSMAGGCIEAFPSLRPVYEAKVSRLAQLHPEIWPTGWSFALPAQAPFTVSALKDGGAELCSTAINQLDQISLRKIVGMPEREEATAGDEELTRRLLLDGAPRVSMGIRFGIEAPARVQAVFPSSPAQAAGIQVGDEIVSVAGRRTPSGTDVMLALFDAPAGETFAVELRRAAQMILVQIVPPHTSR